MFETYILGLYMIVYNML